MPSTVQVARGRSRGGPFERGRDIYNYRCYFCHGYNGDARTLAATYLSPPPRDFTAADPMELDRRRMIEAVRRGKAGTAMQSFGRVLGEAEIEAVVDFVRQAFMAGDRENTAYHTAANGWPDHQRYAPAFPFATGEIALDVPEAELTARQRQGRRMFMSSCITCHDRSRVRREGRIWNRRAISYPRGAYAHNEPEPDSVSGASPYAVHDKPPDVAGLTDQQRRGERLFQENCAFCHGADGTGKNWIGSFLQPHPRNLTDPQATGPMTRQRLESVIRDGLPGTTMPAWKHVLDDRQVAAIAAYVMTAMVDGPGR